MLILVCVTEAPAGWDRGCGLESRDMEATVARPVSKAILIDLGGVLIKDYLPAAAAAWGIRLGITPQVFMEALFGGSDGQVVIGRVSEQQWWDIVAVRLGASPDLVAELRQDLADREVWDEALAGLVRGLRDRARTAIVSNAWPGTRERIVRAGMLDLVDQTVLSCEVGYAKPDPRIYQAALGQLAASPGDALFIDDMPANVAAAQSLGITGHAHTSTASTVSRIEGFVAGTAAT